MMDRLFRWLERTMTWRRVVAACLAFAACSGAFAWRREVLGSCDRGPDGRRGGYTPAELAEYLGCLDRWGRGLYGLSEVTLDLLFPLVYGTLLGWLVVRLWSRPRADLLLGYVICAVVADWGENLTLA